MRLDFFPAPMVLHRGTALSTVSTFQLNELGLRAASAEEMKRKRISFDFLLPKPSHQISNNSRSSPVMTSINDSLSPDLLFNIFKRLDSFETTIVRRVCKQWFEILDEHQSFWRTLHLPEHSLKKWDPLILELFDRKSGSTLQNVEVGTDVKEHFLIEFFHILQKSKESLRCLHFTSGDVYYLNRVDPLSLFIKVECLRILSPHRNYKVCLRRKSIKRDSQEDGSNAASPLKVLYYGTGRSIIKINSVRFKNLVSLDIGITLSSSEWRDFLEGPSRNLKHLRIGFRNGSDEDHSGVPMLDFPNLEVLELINGGRFPQWLLISDFVKLIAISDVSNLPSISELWLWDPIFYKNEIVNRLPKLETLCLLGLASDEVENVLHILNKRKGNVEAGLQVDGVKMEMIKTLILPFTLSESYLSAQEREHLSRCRELVEVVEGGGQSRTIEVEY